MSEFIFNPLKTIAKLAILVVILFGSFCKNKEIENIVTSYRNKKYFEAISKADKLIESNSKSWDAYKYRGLAKYEIGDFSSAYNDLTCALQHNTKDLLLLNAIGNIQYKKGNYEQAHTTFITIVSIDSSQANANYNLSLFFSNINDYDSAYYYVLKEIKWHPDFLDSYAQLLHIYFHKHKYNSVINLADKLIAYNPSIRDSYVFKGISLFLLHKYDLALATIKLVGHDYPDFTNYIFDLPPADIGNLGDILYKEGDADKAFLLFIVSYLKDSTQKGVNYNLSVCFDFYKDYDNALYYATKEIQNNPKDVQSIFFLAHLYNAKEMYELAISTIDLGLKYDTHISDAFYYKSIALYYLKKYDEALWNIDYAIKIEPDYLDYYNSKCILFIKLNRLDDALNTCNFVLKIDPENADANYYKNWILNDTY